MVKSCEYARFSVIFAEAPDAEDLEAAVHALLLTSAVSSKVDQGCSLLQDALAARVVARLREAGQQINQETFKQQLATMTGGKLSGVTAEGVPLEALVERSVTRLCDRHGDQHPWSRQDQDEH